MNKSSRITVSRPVALFLPPVLALILAAGYTQYRSGKAADEAHALCARFPSGALIDDFVRDALAADFEVRDEGRDSNVLIAAKSVYRFAEEQYRCTVRHDGKRILMAEVSKVEVD